MYDIRQFKPSLYLVVLIGLSGYALAAESPGLWVFAFALVLTNIWMVRQGTFRPIPRAVATAVSVLAFLWAFLQVRTRSVDSPILAIGQFLVLLQIVKVWEQRANRDYAQLLVLSLLLMVAAAISTASLAFGALFVLYLLASLYCCLLFHLKVETDNAREALLPVAAGTAGDPAGDPAGAGARAGGGGSAGTGGAGRDRAGSLSVSMRRLTGLIAAYALVAAVAVFLFFPRGPGAGLFGQYVWKPRQTLTGFSEQVSFQDVARITQSNDQMGTVKLTRGGAPLQLAGSLLLRGATEDYYSGNTDTDGHGPYQWSHAPDEQDRWRPMVDRDNGTWRPFGAPDDPGPPPPAAVHQELELNPTGTPVLFALAGLTRMRIDDPTRARQLRVEFSQGDQTVRVTDPLKEPLRYSVDSTGELDDATPPAHRPSVIDPAIAAFVRQPAVTGGLAARREADAAGRPAGYVSPLDEQVAAVIEAYLRHNYAYTLDLTEVRRVRHRDPMVAFLTDFKKGHCEYFAGAMTLMCQSLGMQARLVVGFNVDEFNNFGHYYVVRQSQAHAWVEVRTARGWVPFDPTSGNEQGAASAGLWQRTKSLFDFMEYTWQRAVISYSSDSRENLIQTVDTRLTRSTYHGAGVLFGLRDKLAAFGDWMTTALIYPLVGVLVGGLVVAILGALAWFAYERYRLRRRAERIGLSDLSPEAQARLVRQLAFYDRLVQLLARHRITRPPHLTPQEFAGTLSFLPANAYDTVRRLTGVFYRIRFGGADLDDGRQRRLLGMVERLEGMMPAAAAER